VKVDLDEITRDGIIKFKFNQPLIVPNFEQKRRNLLAMSDLDVSRDIVQITFGLNSESTKVTDVRFTLQIIEWEEDHLHVFMNFTDPLQISQGNYRDQLKVKIVNPNLFISKLSGEPLPSSSLKLSKSIPR